MTQEKKWIWTIWNDLLNLFFPNLCKVCKRPLIKGEEQICLDCLNSMARTNYHKYAVDNPVEQRFIGKCPIEKASAFLLYEKDTKVQKLVHSLKYYGHKELAYVIGRQMALELHADHSPLCNVDILIPVPLHPRRKQERGYNQSEWIAMGIQSALGIPIDSDCVSRTVRTNTQTKKKRYERWINVYSIFKVDHPERLIGKHVLLIDDVVTTGSTLTACANALSEVSGIRISILALSTV